MFSVLLAGEKSDKSPCLDVQRDIFVFQCFIGCRVGDLMKMTRAFSRYRDIDEEMAKPTTYTTRKRT